jgi:hypothetical protein
MRVYHYVSIKPSRARLVGMRVRMRQPSMGSRGILGKCEARAALRDRTFRRRFLTLIDHYSIPDQERGW